MLIYYSCSLFLEWNQTGVLCWSCSLLSLHHKRRILWSSVSINIMQLSLISLAFYSAFLFVSWDAHTSSIWNSLCKWTELLYFVNYKNLPITFSKKNYHQQKIWKLNFLNFVLDLKKGELFFFLGKGKLTFLQYCTFSSVLTSN